MYVLWHNQLMSLVFPVIGLSFFQMTSVECSLNKYKQVRSIMIYYRFGYIKKVTKMAFSTWNNPQLAELDKFMGIINMCSD